MKDAWLVAILSMLVLMPMVAKISAEIFIRVTDKLYQKNGRDKRIIT